MLHSLGRDAEALTHLQRAIELNPMAVDAFCTAASACAALGDGDRAAFFAANALFRDPEGEATRAAVVEVLGGVMATWSPERASQAAGEILHKVPAMRAIADRLVEQLSRRAPAVAPAVRAALGTN